jgi:hypothetical protein
VSRAFKKTGSCLVFAISFRTSALDYLSSFVYMMGLPHVAAVLEPFNLHLTLSQRPNASPPGQEGVIRLFGLPRPAPRLLDMARWCLTQLRFRICRRLFLPGISNRDAMMTG